MRELGLEVRAGEREALKRDIDTGEFTAGVTSVIETGGKYTTGTGKK
jgi:hypothetical protein